MAIIRHKLNDYESVTDKAAKKGGAKERKSEDFDLGWGENRVYVLDEHEWWDPRTSTKYDGQGMSRHAMYGPAVIVYNFAGGSSNSHEYHVNDPSAWAYVRRCIDEGHAAPGKMPLGPSYKENLVTIRSTGEKENT